MHSGGSAICCTHLRRGTKYFASCTTLRADRRHPAPSTSNQAQHHSASNTPQARSENTVPPTGCPQAALHVYMSACPLQIVGLTQTTTNTCTSTTARPLSSPPRKQQSVQTQVLRATSSYTSPISAASTRDYLRRLPSLVDKWRHVAPAAINLLRPHWAAFGKTWHQSARQPVRTVTGLPHCGTAKQRQPPTTSVPLDSSPNAQVASAPQM